MTRPSLPRHVVDYLEWIKNPDRKPYRISINDRGHAVVRAGELVLGIRDTLAEAFALIDDAITNPWGRAQ